MADGEKRCLRFIISQDVKNSRRVVFPWTVVEGEGYDLFASCIGVGALIDAVFAFFLRFDDDLLARGFAGFDNGKTLRALRGDGVNGTVAQFCSVRADGFIFRSGRFFRIDSVEEREHVAVSMVAVNGVPPPCVMTSPVISTRFPGVMGVPLSSRTVCRVRSPLISKAEPLTDTVMGVMRLNAEKPKTPTATRAVAPAAMKRRLEMRGLRNGLSSQRG